MKLLFKKNKYIDEYCYRERGHDDKSYRDRVRETLQEQ